MIYLIYICLAICIVFLSNKASVYVDLLDKKTSLSGAFIGGVLLSAVTSLPELFTSLSSTMLLNQPELSIGNILGSNLFNVAILALLILLFYSSFKKTKIAKSHFTVTVCVSFIYLFILLNMMRILNFSILTISVTSILIVVCYIIGVRNMSSDSNEQTIEEDTFPLTVKQITLRFVAVSLGIILLSIGITYATDSIATQLNLGSGLAGALFLGIATSLPEVSSTIALFRIKNYNIAIGNIIGSNLFNFVILAIVDVFYLGSGIYTFQDPKTASLLVLGFIATPLLALLFKKRNSLVQILCPIGLILCYMTFLVG